MKISKNIIITGGNRGIGKGIIESIIKQAKPEFNRIILCSRVYENGLQVKNEVESEFGNEISNKIDVFKLDITSKSEVNSFINTVKSQYNHIDCLINNAGVKFKDSEVSTDVFDKTMSTNYYSTKDFTEVLLLNQVLSKKSKIIFISSSVGKVNIIKNTDLAKRFLSKDLSVDCLNKLCEEYRESILKNTWRTDGWPSNIYYFSKYMISKYSNILSSREDIVNQSIQVYSYCPGWVRTRMGGEKASRSVSEGVKGVLFLLNKDDEVDSKYQGQLVFDTKTVNIDRI